ncbi:MAG: methyltransferase domain-containing protein [Chloroflexi bacterium]|nr:methyltransferase domain-containing protein [Chloroflexota bacterium]
MPDHFDILAPVYDRLIGPPDPARLRALLRLPVSGWLLDAGGGTGRVAAALRPYVGGLVISDQSRPMLRRARDKQALHPVQAQVHRLPFPAGFFGRILVVDALHHFLDQPAAARELARVLAPGGRLVVEEPDIARPAVKLVALAERMALMGSTFLAPDVVRDLLATQGLVAHVAERDRFSAWIIADKPDEGVR